MASQVEMDHSRSSHLTYGEHQQAQRQTPLLIPTGPASRACLLFRKAIRAHVARKAFPSKICALRFIMWLSLRPAGRIDAVVLVRRAPGTGEQASASRASVEDLSGCPKTCKVHASCVRAMNLWGICPPMRQMGRAFFRPCSPVTILK